MNKYYGVCCALISLHSCHAMENSKKLTWEAKNYKENSSPQDHFAQYALAQVVLQEHYKVLDVGCGNGKTTSYIATKVPKGFVKGIDSSQTMIDLANADYEKQENIKFKLMDITKFDSKPKFDIAVAFNSLPWVKDQKKAYENIAQSLVSGGRLIALVSDVDSPVLQAYQTMFTSFKWKSYFESYTPSYYPCSEKSVKECTVNAAFKSLMVKKIEMPIMVMSKENFIKALAGTPGVKDVIPHNEYMNFLNDVVSEYLTMVSEDENGNVKVDAGLLLVMAEKL